MSRENKKHTGKSKPGQSLTLRLVRRTIRVTIDDVLLLGFIRKLHGRFWGVAGIAVIHVGIGFCFLIKPDLWDISTALSDFGGDVLTAPFFAGTMFFSGYALWRWHNYLKRTLRHARPITGLIALTVIGMYLVALMPVTVYPWPYRIHFAGVFLVGICMALTVLADGALSKTPRTKGRAYWRLLRFAAVGFILLGGYITFGSDRRIAWFQLSLLGEYLLFLGYSVWIVAKTWQGEGPRTQLSHLLKRVVIID